MAKHHSDGGHVSPAKQFFRALLGILSSVGFGALWYAIFHGVQARPYAFILGFLLVVNAVYHIVVAIRGQR
ncbi:MAG: hypothetical protein IKJ35_08360 [Clostridia bacterium]|nr:hypothetical protein [Clostridia bacterium]